MFYQNIGPDDAGAYRTQKVFISGMDVTLPDPERVEKLMKQFEKELVSLKTKLHPIAHAAIIQNKLVTIHPFIHGWEWKNSKTAHELTSDEVRILHYDYPTDLSYGLYSGFLSRE